MEHSPKANLYNFFFSALCQVIGLGIGRLYITVQNSFNILDDSIYHNYNLLLLIFVHSVSACLLARFLKMPFIWQLFNLLLVPSIVLYEYTSLPAGILIIACLVSILIYLPTFWTRIPYYPTSNQTYQVISDVLRDKFSENQKFSFLDLGCGFSDFLCYLSKNHPDSEFYGTDISPLPCIVSKIRSFFRKNLKISCVSFWNMDFSKYDVIYAFLAPPPMEKLWEKVQKEMKKGSLFISNSFEVPHSPDKTIEINDKRKCKIMLFNIR